MYASLTLVQHSRDAFIDDHAKGNDLINTYFLNSRYADVWSNEDTVRQGQEAGQEEVTRPILPRRISNFGSQAKPLETNMFIKVWCCYPWLTPVRQLSISGQKFLFKDKIYEPNKWPEKHLKIHKNNLWQQRPRVTHFTQKKHTKTGKNFIGWKGENFLAGQNIYPWIFPKIMTISAH